MKRERILAGKGKYQEVLGVEWICINGE